MRLGMSSAAYYGRFETEDAAGYLNTFDLDTCEVFLQTFSEYTPAFGKTVRDKLKGLDCASVHPKGTQFELDLFGSSERQRRDAMQIFEGVCASGEQFGAKFYVLHGPPCINTRRRPDGIRNLKQIFPEMQKIAGVHGIEVLWENVSWCPCRECADVEMLLDMFPEQRFVLDIKQAQRSGIDPLDMAACMGKHLAHVHVLDWDETGTLTLPGQGIFDFPALMKILRKNGYDGCVILEPYSAQAQNEDAIRRSLSYLRTLIEGTEET